MRSPYQAVAKDRTTLGCIPSFRRFLALLPGVTSSTFQKVDTFKRRCRDVQSLRSSMTRGGQSR